MKITDYKVILASNSPRREELLRGINIDFQVKVLSDIDETYPSDISAKEIAEYVAKKKANSYTNTLKKDELLITADTIVILNDKVLGKPRNKEDAKEMLLSLSGKIHCVISGV